MEALELSKRAHYTGELRITYEDEEGDKVTVATNADFVEMLRQHGQTDDLLRISIVPGRKSEEAGERGHCGRHGFRHFKGFGPLHGLLQQLKVGLPEMLNNPAIRSMAEGLISANSGLVRIDTGHVCDSCQATIMGDRFASTTKENFDLCSACMLSETGQKLEPEHKFKKIGAFDALMECLRQGGGVEAFFAGGEAEAQAEQAKVHHAICDVCQGSIVGSRFKSLAENDYDECAACRAKSSRPADEFFEIKDPSLTVPESVKAEYRARKEAEAAKAKSEHEAQARKAAAEAEAKKKAEAPRMVQSKPVVVEQPKPAPAPVAPPAEPERQPSAFEVNLQTLESMGFTDRKRNIATLVRNRNELFATIQELLQ